MVKIQPTSELITFPKSSPIQLREWTISINNWVTQAYVGIWPNEKDAPQSIRLSLKCTFLAPQPQDRSSAEDVVCYDQLMQRLSTLIASKHFHLVENLCEAIANTTFEDRRVTDVFVRIEKLDHLPNGASFGVEIHRQRNRFQ